MMIEQIRSALDAVLNRPACRQTRTAPPCFKCFGLSIKSRAATQIAQQTFVWSYLPLELLGYSYMKLNVALAAAIAALAIAGCAKKEAEAPAADTAAPAADATAPAADAAAGAATDAAAAPADATAAPADAAAAPAADPAAAPAEAPKQ
jgi:hypothetical protein